MRLCEMYVLSLFIKSQKNGLQRHSDDRPLRAANSVNIELQSDSNVQESSNNLLVPNEQEDLVHKNENEGKSDERQSKSNEEKPETSKDDTNQVGFKTVESNTFQNKNRLSTSGLYYYVF